MKIKLTSTKRKTRYTNLPQETLLFSTRHPIIKWNQLVIAIKRKLFYNQHVNFYKASIIDTIRELRGMIT